MVTDSTSPGSDLYPPLHINGEDNSKRIPKPQKKRTTPPDKRNIPGPSHSSKWSYLAWEYRQNSPYCQECQREGITVPALYTAHRIPWPLCRDFWDPANWITLCKKHYREKRKRDKIQIQEQLQ